MVFSDQRQVGAFLRSATGQWFSPDTPLFSTNETDRHDITEILLNVALNAITLTLYVYSDMPTVRYIYI